MNLLAHLYLSGDNRQLMLGNFMADAVKGRRWQNYPLDIQRGIRLHRAIDEYTDNHPAVRRSTHRLQSTYHKYSPVIIDLAYDHFLADNWTCYSSRPLDHFVYDAYAVLLRNYSVLPARTRRFVPFMILSNWLRNYEKLSGLDRSLKGLARRTPFKSGMEHAITDIKREYTPLLKDFREFFPQVIEFAGKKLSKL